MRIINEVLDNLRELKHERFFIGKAI